MHGVSIVAFNCVARLLALTISPAAAQDFYKGMTIRVIVATTPGGGFDAYSRMLTRHMGKHIPGHPAFVVENMPGAAFLIGTNYLYTHAKPDGLTLGNWIGTLVLHQLTGRKGIEFDARKFEYIGAITYLYSFPPGTPKDRVQIFRKAFQATLKDPEFIAEAKKGNFELDPVAG